MDEIKSALMCSTAQAPPPDAAAATPKRRRKDRQPRKTTAARQHPQRRKQDRRVADSSDGDASDSGDEPDSLVADPEVAKELGNVSLMTIWRWSHNTALGFPVAVKIGRFNYRSRRKLEEFKARLVRDAIARRAAEDVA